MRTSTAIWIGATSVALLDVAASVEAFRSGHPVIGVITAIAAVTAAGLAWVARRPAIELRADLGTWTAHVAAATGEPERAVVNRAVARHRAALDGERGADG